MTKEFEKKIKEAKNEEELLKVLDSNDANDSKTPEKLTDEELEVIAGGGGNCCCKTIIG